MEMDTAHRKQSSGPTGQNTARNNRNADALQAILDELDRPLDAVDWSHTTLRGSRGEGPRSLLKRLRRERQVGLTDFVKRLRDGQ